MCKVGVVADDLTGACDTGAKFAGEENKVTVFTDPDYFDFGMSIPVINIQSRFLAKQEACRRVTHAAKLLERSGASTVLKKIDTMFKGNIGPETEAMMDALHSKLALVIPAIPEMRRVTLHGHQFINGMRIDKLPSSQVVDSYLPTLLSCQCSRKVGHIDLTIVKGRKIKEKIMNLFRKGSEVIVIDAEKQQDIEQIVKASLNLDFRPLFVGSLGLAKALSAYIFPHLTSDFLCPKKEGMILVISASSNPAAQNQFKYMEKTGSFSSISINSCKIANKDKKKVEKKVKDKIKEALSKEQDILLRVFMETLNDRTKDKGKGRLLVDCLAFIASSIIPFVTIGGLILIGGETAYHLCENIETRTIDVLGEIRPGIACGVISIGKHMGTPLIVKGGSVGTEDSVVKSVCYLRGNRQRRLSR